MPHLDALAQTHLRQLRVPEGAFDEAAERERVRDAFAQLLTAMQEGRATDHVVTRFELWTEGRLPGVAPIQATEALTIYQAQKRALLSFVPRFSQAPDVLLAVTEALDAHYDALQNHVLRRLVVMGEETAARNARFKAEQEVKSLYTAELEQLHQQLEAELARKRAIIHASIDAVVTIDADNLVLEFNPAAEQMFGYAATEILGRDMTDILVPERYRERHRRGIKHFMATGEGPALRKRVEMPAMRRDGTEFPAEFVIIDLAIEGQVAFTSFIRDLTEIKKAREAEQQLEVMKQADLLKDQFLSILSHELRTPINAIMGFGSVLEDGVAGELNETQRRYVRKVLASSDVLLALVDDLLDMSRIQAGKFSLKLGELHFSQVASDVASLLTPLIEQNALTLEMEVPQGLKPIPADAQRVAQVLTNYLNNAIKFTPPGGTIRIRAEMNDTHLRCEVEDTGEGIAPEDLAKLFRRFGQLDSSNTRRAKGTGLGLSISKALIEAHGGTVGVTSDRGRGSTFWFELPLEPSPAALASDDELNVAPH